MKKRNMKKNLFKNKKKNIGDKKYCNACTEGCGYFLAFIGATIYYLQNATSFWNGVLGVLKALVWPAILIHKLLGFLS